MHRAPQSGPDDHGRRRATAGGRRQKRLAEARARRDACARLADHSRQCRNLRDDRDRLYHARPAVAARACCWRARLQSLSACYGAWHRYRCGAVADRRCKNWRWRERRGAQARNASVALISSCAFPHRLDLPLADGADFAGYRRTGRPCARRRNLHARLSVEPAAKSSIHHCPLHLFRA
jgi:hypothetical protein